MFKLEAGRSLFGSCSSGSFADGLVFSFSSTLYSVCALEPLLWVEKLLPLLGNRSCWNTDVRGEGASRSMFQTCNSGPSWERNAGGCQPAHGQGAACPLLTCGMWATVYQRFCWDWNIKFRRWLFRSPQKIPHFMSPGLFPPDLIRLSIIFFVR